MELRHLKYFLAVAEELNFTKAAERLFISQPPLSRQIRELENELGATLFLRNNKRVQLTEAGVYFKKEIEKQLQDLDAICIKTRKIAEHLTGEYRIGYISSTFSKTITDVVQFLIRKYPYLNIKLFEVNTAQQIKDLEQGKLDLGILRAPVIADTLQTSVWFKDTYALVFNPRYFQISSMEDIKAMKDVVFVFFNQAYAPMYHQGLLEICAYYHFTPNVVHESNNINSILQLVTNGLGVSIVPSSVAQHASKALKFLAVDKAFYSTVLLASKHKHTSEVTESALQYLQRSR